MNSNIQNLGGWQRFGARVPSSNREQIIKVFRSSENIKYLQTVLAQVFPAGPLRDFALDTLSDSVYSFGEADDVIYSDSAAQRRCPAASLWQEVRRLNRAFCKYRISFLRDKESLIAGRHDDISTDDEPYHYRMFIADSLRPPGLEHLNGAGPLYGIHENQSTGPREGFTIVPAYSSNPAVASDEWGWDNGDPNRTAEQAIGRALTDYWGEDIAEKYADASVLRSAETGGPRDIDLQRGGTRFMRYPTIPIWQNLSRNRDHDRDIEETLGTGSRELDSSVRRWDMDLLKKYRDDRDRAIGY